MPVVLDSHKNLAYSTLQSALTTGAGSAVVQAGHGARFPTPPFNVTLWPLNQIPTPSNAEIARCTAIATDTLTLTRAQEGSAAKALAAGDQIAATITVKTLTDIEQALPDVEFIGDWSAVTAYVDGEVVIYNGVPYMAVKPSTNQAPVPWAVTGAGIQGPPGPAGPQGPPGSGMLTGMVAIWFTGTPPSGYLLLDGSAVSRATYADLFALWGTTYGTGDGSTTFNLPDCRGRFPVGVGTHADVNALGKNEGIAAVGSRTPKHRHTVNDSGHGHGINDPGHSHTFALAYDSGGSSYPSRIGGNLNENRGTSGVGTGISVQSGATGITVGTPGNPLDSAPFIAVNWIVKT